MKYIVIINIALIFISCDNSSKHNSKFTTGIINSQSYIEVESSPVVIDDSKTQVIQYTDINKILKSIQYIPLQSKSPIGMITSVVVYDGKIYILDSYKSESIYIFDMLGELKKTISSKGDGPQEYAGLADMCISKRNNELVVSDRLSLQILYYTLDGDFKRKARSTPNGYIEMIEDSRINVLTYGQSFDKDVNYHIISSLEDSITRKGFPYSPIQKKAVNYRPIYKNYKDELLFSPVLSDTIYQIMNDSLYNIKYIVDQKKSIWLKKEEDLETEEYRNLIKRSGYTVLGDPIIENQYYLSYPISYGKNDFIRQEVHWYDKRNGYSFTLGSRIDQDSPITFWIPAPITLFENSFVGILEATQIDELKRYLANNNNMDLLQDERLRSILTDESKEIEAILVLFEFQ